MSDCPDCLGSGWRTVYELVTWRDGAPPVREPISEAKFRGLEPLVEGLGVRQVYRNVKPCHCPKGSAHRPLRQAPDRDPDEKPAGRAKVRKRPPSPQQPLDWKAEATR